VLGEGTDEYPPLVVLTAIDLEGFDPLEPMLIECGVTE
jgi:hypothetical protein